MITSYYSTILWNDQFPMGAFNSPHVVFGYLPDIRVKQVQRLLYTLIVTFLHCLFEFPLPSEIKCFCNLVSGSHWCLHVVISCHPNTHEPSLFLDIVCSISTSTLSWNTYWYDSGRLLSVSLYSFLIDWLMAAISWKCIVLPSLWINSFWCCHMSHGISEILLWYRVIHNTADLILPIWDKLSVLSSIS